MFTKHYCCSSSIKNRPHIETHTAPLSTDHPHLGADRSYPHLMPPINNIAHQPNQPLEPMQRFHIKPQPFQLPIQITTITTQKPQTSSEWKSYFSTFNGKIFEKFWVQVPKQILGDFLGKLICFTFSVTLLTNYVGVICQFSSYLIL